MLDLLSTAVLVTFLAAPVLLTVSVVGRYRMLSAAIQTYAELMDAVILRIEQNRDPDVGEIAARLGSASDGETPASPARRWWRTGRRVQPSRQRLLDIATGLRDYLTVVRAGESERERWITFRRKNLQMQRELSAHVEFCRTTTETLPYVGILGTLLGLLLSLDDLGASPTVAGLPAAGADWSGLIIAMSSTAVALSCLLVIKLLFERHVVPRYVQLEETLRAVEAYGARYGDVVRSA